MREQANMCALKNHSRLKCWNGYLPTHLGDKNRPAFSHTRKTSQCTICDHGSIEKPFIRNSFEAVLRLIEIPTLRLVATDSRLAHRFVFDFIKSTRILNKHTELKPKKHAKCHPRTRRTPSLLRNRYQSAGGLGELAGDFVTR
jgi:hypothetical protein